MKKVLSLLLFGMITLAMSMPLYAGELRMKNSFKVSMYSLDRGNFSKTVDGNQIHASHGLGSRGSYSAEAGVSINWSVTGAGGGWGYSAGTENEELKWKAIYAKWATEKFYVSAGYNDVGFANGYVMQSDGWGGVKLGLMPSKDIMVTMFGALTSENNPDELELNYGVENTSDGENTEDSYMYGIELLKKLPNRGFVSAYYLSTANAEVTSDNPRASNPTGADLQSVGAGARVDLNGMVLTGEAATFFGDRSNGTDATGFIVAVGAQIPINEALSAAVNFHYAPGDDNDDKTAITYFSKRGARQPLQQGLGRGFDHDDGNLQFFDKNGTDPFNLNGQECGVYMLGLSTEYKLPSMTAFSAGVVYAMPAQDTDVNPWDNILKLNAGIFHPINKSLATGIGVSYLVADADDMWEDAGFGAGVFMGWSF